MKLITLLGGETPLIIRHEGGNPDIKSITFDSRKVEPGCCFVAQIGTRVDGHAFIATAVAHGASAVVCSRMPASLAPGVAYVQVQNSDIALGVMADNLYGNPSRHLKLVGVTGTNGKTTTVTLLHRLFRSMGCHAGLLSTIVNMVDDQPVPSTHTTPDALELNSLLSRMVKAGCQYAFIEVSSHSVVQNRIAGLTFAGGIFSNITHDHLDFHKTMAAYIAAKKAFFDHLPPAAFALTNIDDPNGLVMVQNTPAHIVTYSLQRVADFRTRVLEESFHGQQLQINGLDVWTPLVGRFNAYNLTAVYAAAILCHVPQPEAARLLSTLAPAEGRFQCLSGRGITAIVDYAHTPDALQNVLRTINQLKRPTQTLITVVGCGGDRDATKRPLMARIAQTLSDCLILTSDNPRTEDPERILDDMEAGLTPDQKSRVLRIADRRQAIRTAVLIAHPGDILLLAGKGHEKYQDIAGVKHHFDDKQELEQLLK